jgi:hypothetical protein
MQVTIVHVRVKLDHVSDFIEATRLKLPKLSAYGVQESDLDHIVAHSRGSSMKTNPICAIR